MGCKLIGMTSEVGDLRGSGAKWWTGSGERCLVSGGSRVGNCIEFRFCNKGGAKSETGVMV